MLHWNEGKFRISGGFCLLTAWFALVNGWRLLITVLGAAALHELGHYLALRLCDGRASGLRVSLLGACMEVESSRLSYGAELMTVLAGPGSNLLAGTALALLGGGAWSTAAGAHLVLGMFNLLPVCPLDGGRALALLMSWAAGPDVGEQIAGWVGAAAAAAAAGLLIWLMRRSGGSLWLLPAVCGLLGAGITGLLAKNRLFL